MNGPDDEALHRFLLEQSPDVLLLVDGVGNLRFANGAARRLLGYVPEEVVGSSAFDKVHPDDLGYTVGALEESVRKSGMHYPIQVRVLHADGTWRDAEITSYTAPSPWGDSFVLVSLRLIDDRDVLPGRRRAVEHLVQTVATRCARADWRQADEVVEGGIAELGEFFGALNATFGIVDHEHGVVTLTHEWSSSATPSLRAVLSEIPLQELWWGTAQISRDFVYTPALRDLPPAGASVALMEEFGVRASLDVPLAPDGLLVAMLSLRWTDEPERWDDALGSLVQALGRILLATMQRSRSEAATHHRSLHDPLTGLANRAQLVAALRRALEGDERAAPSGLALLFCDLDGFKLVNDRHGHETGDRALVEVAAALREAVRPGDLVSRIGGDEFVVLCQRLMGRAEAETIAQRLETAVERVVVSDHALAMSVGIAWAEGDADADQLLIAADRAMYRAKEGRRDAGLRAS